MDGSGPTADRPGPERGRRIDPGAGAGNAEPDAAGPAPGDARRPGRRLATRLGRAILAGAMLGAAIEVAVIAVPFALGVDDGARTERVALRFTPPVLAGQNVPHSCTGGFYARHGATIVLTIAEHCGGAPGSALADDAGRLLGWFGPRLRSPGCADARPCAPAEFQPLVLAPDRIPWGHLNLVDLGAGGYRTVGPGQPPLACADIRPGASVEIDGRERYRTGRVVSSSPLATDRWVFPCLVVADVPVALYDSGSPVLVDGAPGGIAALRLGSPLSPRAVLGFTPLAEGLALAGLELCTEPDCGLSPATVVQTPYGPQR